VAPRIIERVSAVTRINGAERIEGRAARGGCVVTEGIREQIARRKRWPLAFWLIENVTGHHVTTETGHGPPLEERVLAHIVALAAALGELRARRP